MIGNDEIMRIARDCHITIPLGERMAQWVSMAVFMRFARAMWAAGFAHSNAQHRAHAASAQRPAHPGIVRPPAAIDGERA